MSVISIDAVSRWYGNVVAVNGISMTVRPGVTGLLGPNGAGKTTIIALMSGFLAPSAGTVTLDGEPVWRRTEAYRTIGLVPERELSFGYLTGRQFVLANAELHGLAVLLALALSGVAGLIASWSTRRGFAVVAIIAVLVIANGIVTAIQGISSEEGRSEVGEIAGLFSPYSLYRGLMVAWTGADFPTPPTSTSMELLYVAVLLALSAGCLLALVLRYRRVATS